MFKVGDIVVAAINWNYISMGEKYVIIRITPGVITLRNCQTGTVHHWGDKPEYFSGEYFKPWSKKEPPKTEVEWLDRVRDNFKE